VKENADRNVTETALTTALSH